jgi:channel protein (hemolysin III family)
MGYAILIIIWALAIAGVFFKIFRLDAPRWLYTGIYLVMGWLIVLATVPLARAVGLDRLFWLVIGGVFYSIGAVIYGLKKPDPVPGPIWLSRDIPHLHPPRKPEPFPLHLSACIGELPRMMSSCHEFLKLRQSETLH